MHKYNVLTFIVLLNMATSFSQTLPPLQISNNRSHFVTNKSEPFLWLGGTAWELLHRLSKEDIDYYLQDRKAKGFTIIQTVILAELNGLNAPNFYGHTPLINNDPRLLNEAYFELVDYTLHKADSLGLYIALLPTWGDKFNKKWGAGPEIFTPENAYSYGKKLAERYVHQQNIVWILGGDRIPEKKVHYEIIRNMAAGIRSVDTIKLISYHPSGAKRATQYVNEEFLDFDMFQSGHNNDEREYVYVYESKKVRPTRPVVNGEARYEHISNRFWESTNNPLLNDYDVRISAYWSIMAGAAGYTYGCNEIWQMYDVGRYAILNASLPWKECMQLPGAQQIKYIRQLFTDYPIHEFTPIDSLVINNPENSSYVIACINEASNTMILYFPKWQEITVNTSLLKKKKQRLTWFNPCTGEYSASSKQAIKETLTIAPPVQNKEGDVILIIND